MSLVYFSGVHGSGKSTLIRSLSPQFVRYSKHSLPEAFTIEGRQRVRQERFYYQALEQLKYSLSHHDEVLVCDRCCLDSLAYSHAFRSLGWLENAAFERLMERHYRLFSDKMPGRVVFFDPPVDFVKGCLARRWKKRKKWREDDLDYLVAVHSSFRNVMSSFDGDLLHLTETDFGARLERFYEWSSVKNVLINQ